MTILKRRKKRHDLLSHVMRLCRWTSPAGALFLFWPTLWGLILGAEGFPSEKNILVCALGCWLMRSAGCVYNDWVDREFDRHVHRAAQRPLAAGTLSVRQAGVILGILGSLSGLLLFMINTVAVMVSLMALPLIALYPWMKRWTYWPQIFLGITFNWGLIVGYAIEAHTLSWVLIPWYVFGFLWTVVYDTVYAYQDIDDDRRIGAKSSALALGSRPHGALWMMTGGMLFSGWQTGMKFFTSFMILSVTYSLWKLSFDRTIEYSEMYGIWFKKSAWWGAWIGLGLLLSRV